MKTIKMNWQRVGAAILFVMVWGLVSCGKKPEAVYDPSGEARPVRVLKLQGGTSWVERSYPGKTSAQDSVEISFEVDGKIMELPMRKGMRVARGDVLAKLDARDFENDLAAQKADYEKAVTELNRYRGLYEKDAVSQQELETRQRDKDVAEARMKIAQKKVEDAVLRAPFDGVVANKYVDNYQSVRTKEPIALIQNNEGVEVSISMPERDLAVVQTSKLESAAAVFDAFPGQSFELKLKDYETQADPVTQTFKVKFIMPNPAYLKILPGMSANVKVRLAAREGVPAAPGFAVPAAAVSPDAGGKPFVWVVDPADRTVHRREVVLGQVTGTENIQITGGLLENEMIAVSGIYQLRDGMKVTPRAAGEEMTR